MDDRINGVLTNRDSKQHLAHAIVVSPGATALRLRLTYAPERGPAGLNALHLSLFDPHGFRGAGHRHGDAHDGTVTHQIELGAAAATPGYQAGPIPPGAWSVVIDTHLIVAGPPVHYELTIEVIDEPATATAAPPAPVPAQPLAPRGPGWYRGDLHGHTVHSDGDWQIPDLLDAAVAHGLDFMTLSDHNTTSGLEAFARLAQGRICTIGASELTTYWGHALALGVHAWVDWRVRPGARTMPQIVADVEAAGGLFIIAHPMSVGDPICTGCNWGYADMMPGPARLVEIWNGGAWDSDSNNEQALALWYSWLSQGRRLVATAGTDTHGPPPQGVRAGFNVVYAEELSESALLRAIASGHLYLSDGPTLALSGRGAGGAEAMMGDSLPAGQIALAIGWEGCAADDRVRLIVDGEARVEQEAGERGSLRWELAAERGSWCTLELRERAGRLRAISNPIFVADVPA